jgi:hypothetical protein
MANAEGDKPPMSSDFDWDVDRPERTQELFERYDVQQAKQIIVASPRPIELIDLTKHGAAIKDYLTGVKLKPDMDWQKVDIEIPVIFVRTKGGKFPIDGRHRLAKALDEGREAIPAEFLTTEETDAIHTTINLT